jgi:hypothetical protein
MTKLPLLECLNLFLKRLLLLFLSLFPKRLLLSFQFQSLFPLRPNPIVMHLSKSLLFLKRLLLEFLFLSLFPLQLLNLFLIGFRLFLFPKVFRQLLSFLFLKVFQLQTMPNQNQNQSW